jgi:hypothetical protein
MKKMLGYSVVLLAAVFLTTTFGQAQTVVTITGVITNIKEVKRHIPKKAYLQLIFVPPSGKMQGVISEGGGILLYSNLPQLPVPANGIFAFKVPTMKPGEYRVAIQELPQGSKLHNILAKGNREAVIEMPKDAKLPLTIDLGEVTIFKKEGN